MAIRDTGTEQLIKDTAKRVFFTDGRFNATTQDIADAAGVTRTVINYYFRSKDFLLQQVFKDAMEETKQKMDEIFLSKLPLKKKVIKFINMFTAEFTQFPYKEPFLISEINSFGFTLPPQEVTAPLQQFFDEVQEAIDKGEIKKMLPVSFLVNLLSLIAYPFITRQLFVRTLDVSDSKFEHMMDERKKMIIEVLFV